MKTCDISSPSPTSRRIGFFDIPTELRIQIYDAYLSSHARSFKNTNQVMMTVAHFPCSALLRTSHQIACELQEHIDFRSRLQILARLIPNPEAKIDLPPSIRTIKTVQLTQHYGAVTKNELFNLAEHDYTRDINATVDLVRSLRKAMPQLRTVDITIMLPPVQKACVAVDAAKLFLTGIREIKQIELRLGSFAYPCPMEKQNKLLAVWQTGVDQKVRIDEVKPRPVRMRIGSIDRMLSM